MTLVLPVVLVALVVLGTAVLLGHPAARPLTRARILASHIRRGLHAECPTQCSEGHTYRRPCALAPTRRTP
ncbi:hypothetical protein L1085_016205 [Streptomyces sp. MSC1_001]|jgi:hypothetical protein|uniref:hypothetical protein n=1 Tax=Streptomyces sp. MSC1_001 TaxID=2909263 RepID=UPI00202F548C|nr:hypothetical protein [Streptomyces sp. MSC1_001]